MSAYFDFVNVGSPKPTKHGPTQWFCVHTITKEVLFQLQQEQEPEPVQDCEWRDSFPFDGIFKPKTICQ